MIAWQLPLLLGVVVASGAYAATGVIIKYDNQLGFPASARRHSVYVSLALGAVVALVAFVLITGT